MLTLGFYAILHCSHVLEALQKLRENQLNVKGKKEESHSNKFPWLRCQWIVCINREKKVVAVTGFTHKL